MYATARAAVAGIRLGWPEQFGKAFRLADQSSAPGKPGRFSHHDYRNRGARGDGTQRSSPDRRWIDAAFEHGPGLGARHSAREWRDAGGALSGSHRNRRPRTAGKNAIG